MAATMRLHFIIGVHTPCRHLAAAEGCYSVVQWLVEDSGADPNPVDRFGRTPLEDAVCDDAPTATLRDALCTCASVP